MPLNLEETKTLLRRTPGVLDVLLRGLPDPWVHEDEGPDTWSSFEVVGHLIEAEETNWIPRVRHLMAHGESAVFPPFDRFGFVEKWKGTSMAELWASSKGRVPKASRISTSYGSRRETSDAGAGIPTSDRSPSGNCSPRGGSTT